MLNLVMSRAEISGPTVGARLAFSLNRQENTRMYRTRFVVLIGLILMVAALRLLPHPPNFAPIGAMALVWRRVLRR